MKRKEEAMKKYIASFLAICMIFVMVPILPAEAAGLEDTERNFQNFLYCADHRAHSSGTCIDFSISAE